MKDLWIAGIARGHNASVCLLKNGEIVFSIEEERLSRRKYDGGPYAAMIKILEYTDKLDYLVVAHTQSLNDTAGRVDFSGDDVYTGLARKLGLIDRELVSGQHPQVVDLSHIHHQLHAACAFYRSGFETATAVIVDGAGTFIPLSVGSATETGWETETIFSCKYPAEFKTEFKHVGVRGPTPGIVLETEEDGNTYKAVISDRAGIVKAYEAVTQYCGFSAIEAGKTMGLFPYGKPNDKIPAMFEKETSMPLTNRNLIVPTYPNASIVNNLLYEELEESESEDLTLLENRRDMAYAVQTETQEQVLELIKKSVRLTGNKNVVVSGGYGLNCVANYFYLKELQELEINLYVEPISNDAGTAIGAALLMDRSLSDNKSINSQESLYLGPKYHFSAEDLVRQANEYDFEIFDTNNNEVAELLKERNIVAIFQGRSENGPRALGNRSLLFDPSCPNGKDYVNEVKRREYFRPFAGTVLEEDVHDWFDLRGLTNSPSMMYAVNCQEDVKNIIPSIIHVDGTCRIQTVNKAQNPRYYDLIRCFKDLTEIPMLFNTSFNLGGEPLVETLDDALRTLMHSDIEYLYMIEYDKLIKAKN